MTLARVIKEFLESPIPISKENDIAEKNKFVDAINDELHHIDAIFTQPHTNDFKQLLQIQIELHRCAEFISILSDYLSTKSGIPEYKAIEAKLNKANEKSLAVQKLFSPQPKTNNMPDKSTYVCDDAYSAKF